MEFKFQMPVKFFAQRGAVSLHQEEFGKYGRRCLIVTGKNSARKSGALDDVVKALEANSVEYEVYDKIGPNPLLSVCHEGGQAAVRFGADFIVGIGGGSPLDAAKAVAAYAANPTIAPEEIYTRREKPALPILLVGTTAGTGSEVTRYSVLTNDRTHQKKSWGDDFSYARVSFGDPAYTASVSREMTLSTALDAVSHALEAYFNRDAGELSDEFCVLALKKLLPALKKASAAEKPEEIDMDTREALYLGSIYAGMAINMSGTCFCHAMGYFLTEERNMPHGFACAYFLPSFLSYSVPLAPEKARRLFREIRMYAEELSLTLLSYITRDYEPASDAQIDALMEHWIPSPNIKRALGDFNPYIRRRVAECVLQKKSAF